VHQAAHAANAASPLSFPCCARIIAMELLHSANARAVQLACPGCPWRAIGVWRWRRRSDPDREWAAAGHHSFEMPPLFDAQTILPSGFL